MNIVGSNKEADYSRPDRDAKNIPQGESAKTHTGAQAATAGQFFSNSLFVTLLAALAIALFVRFFIASPYMVTGASMEPTFETWNYLIVDRVSYRFGEPERGEVVVFRFPQDPSRSFIKRVIGLPEETVILEGNTVIIKNEDHPDGFTLDEPYVASENGRSSRMTVELGEGEYFVLGDNRKESADSRVWGNLPREFIVGKTLARLYPVTSISLRPGEAEYSAE